MDSKKIGTFKEFLKEQRQKKINEARVNIECDWWDDYEIAEIPNEVDIKNETAIKEALNTSNKKIIISYKLV